jgi:hypothetical protein
MAGSPRRPSSHPGKARPICLRLHPWLRLIWAGPQSAQYGNIVRLDTIWSALIGSGKGTMGQSSDLSVGSRSLQAGT